MGHRIALSHASGIAAEAILEKLSESGVKPDSLILLDRESNLGERVPFAGGRLGVQDQDGFDLSECALLLMPESDSNLAAAAIAQGCLLVSHTITSDSAPIFMPDVHSPPALAYNQASLRLAGPELSCLLPVLLELNRDHAIVRLNLTLLRSAEFRGKAGLEELATQTVNLFNSKDVEPRVFPQQIAFNLLPDAPDPFLVSDLRRILGNNSYSDTLSVTLQSVNVPVFHGLVVAVQICFDSRVSIEDCKNRLSRLDKVIVKDGQISPVSDCNQSFSCTISFPEKTPDQPSDLQFWMIMDPMRYGLANNYVNVTDFLLESFL